MRKIMRFEPLSVMRIAAICYAMLGFLEGTIFCVAFSILPFAAKSGTNMRRFFGLLFGVLSIVVFPSLFAVIGAIAGGLTAVIYNVSAKYVGGVEIEAA